jgi:hypothetical protein
MVEPTTIMVIAYPCLSALSPHVSEPKKEPWRRYIKLAGDHL